MTKSINQSISGIPRLRLDLRSALGDQYGVLTMPVKTVKARTNREMGVGTSVVEDRAENQRHRFLHPS
jgi:hypothetical protein